MGRVPAMARMASLVGTKMVSGVSHDSMNEVSSACSMSRANSWIPCRLAQSANHAVAGAGATAMASVATAETAVGSVISAIIVRWGVGVGVGVRESAASMKGARLAPHSHGTSHSHSGRVAENLWKPVGF